MPGGAGPPPFATDAAPPTRRAALAQATQFLTAAGVPDAATDARLLLCSAAGLDRLELMLRPEALLDPAAAERLRAALARRAGREPVARILGRRGFWGLDVEITPAVLDPRPETETLVAAALGACTGARRKDWRIVDLGTGSGAILAALLSELPAARGWGVDRSAAACRVARRNLDRLGLAARSLVLQGDWGAALADRSFELVVSNPPYVETATIATLDPDVRDHDPQAALDGGPDGLAAYRLIAATLPRLLAPGGQAFFEVGAGQAEAVATLCRTAGLQALDTHRDLAGIERVVAVSARHHGPDVGAPRTASR